MSATDIDALRVRLERLEAEHAIRGVMAEYMALCDRLDESTPMDELAELFTREAVWTGKGRLYQAAFGEHRGRAAISRMLGSYRGPPPHFEMNAHFLTSEWIDASARPALGRWMMLQTSTYMNGTSDLRCARLSVQFTLEENRWRISRFETENLFSRSIDRWRDQTATPVPPNSGE
jgi:hypothetical protein